MADNPFSGLGTEFMSWQKAPSIMETLKGGKSPILNLLGLALGGMGMEGQSAPPLGQGIAPPAGPQMGVNPVKPGGLGISSSQFNIPSLTLPQIGTPTSQAPGIDIDGDGQVDNFWGLKK